MERVPITLAGVPETMLWTLYHRSREASRPDAVLHDPLAPDLVARIDFPFEERFGTSDLGQVQGLALRSKTFDREVGRYLRTRPDGQVVALGEGLETQFWRVDNGRVRWLSVDLPEAIDARRRLLPDEPRARLLAASAIEDGWVGEVGDRGPVLVVAQGLFMYLQPGEVHAIVATIARNLPGATLLFDSVAPWVSARSRRAPLRTRSGYEAPPMPWALDRAERQRLLGLDPAVAGIQRVAPARGRGMAFGIVVPLLRMVPALDERLPMWSVHRLQVAPAPVS